MLLLTSCATRIVKVQLPAELFTCQQRPVIPGKKGDKLDQHQKGELILRLFGWGEDCEARLKAAGDEAQKQGAVIGR